MQTETSNFENWCLCCALTMYWINISTDWSTTGMYHLKTNTFQQHNIRYLHQSLVSLEEVADVVSSGTGRLFQISTPQLMYFLWRVPIVHMLNTPPPILAVLVLNTKTSLFGIYAQQISRMYITYIWTWNCLHTNTSFKLLPTMTICQASWLITSYFI